MENFNFIPKDKINKISFTRPDVVDERLFVITPVFNSPRFRTIWKLYNEFEHYVVNSGAHLVTIEASFGNREESITENISENHTVIHVRAESELWVKENLLNLAIQRIPESAQYIAWIDSDVKFARTDWVGETIQQLQHFDIVQMFSVAQDLDPNGLPYQFNSGFVYDYIRGIPFKKKFTKVEDEKKTRLKGKRTSDNCYCYDDCDDCPDCPDYPPKVKIHKYHPGFAWAYRRKALNDLGGLFELGILGAGDNHMATALIGQCEKSIHPGMSQEYKDQIKIWQDRAIKYINYNIGYVDGTLLHSFHGAKKNRKYGERWNILVRNEYTPSTDIKRNVQGVYQLEQNKPKLRDEIRQYFGERNADNIDMQGTIGFLD